MSAMTRVYQQAMVWQQGLGSWEVLVNWKLANVIPVFKKDKNEDPSNYRSVSLTSVTGKITVKIILEVIGKHLRK